MPFDARTYPDSQTALDRRRRQRVAAWLFAVSFMIWGMVVLGGATRLTGSGLSIMEWAPLSGALPPMSDAEWNRLFALYKQIPQYTLLHPDMDLAGFRDIFWLEWTHRAWGRLMGVAFAVPLVWLAVTGAIPRRLIPRLAGLFVLGGLQGAVGWFMVASGFFPDSTAVSPYRLVVHLTLALALFAAVFWTALSVAEPTPISVPRAGGLRRLASVAGVLVAATIVAGGFTAGLHAGLTYNTFPLMDSRLIPAGYASLHPFLRNLTENVAAVQFDHRLLATLAALATLGTVAWGLAPARRASLPPTARIAIGAMGAMILVQYALGVATLLSVVAVPLAVAHQANAVLLLACAIWVTHSLRGAKSSPGF
jgi:cytochrome c oxidase assembly protein subunit 15